MDLKFGRLWWLCGFVLVAVASHALAEESGKKSGFVGLSKDRPYIYVIHDGSSVKIQRIQDPDFQLSGYFSKTVRACPPFCIKPISPDPAVKVVGEIEVFDFIEKDLRDGRGILIDARTPAWFNKATIPGSVNIPFTQLTKEPDSPEMIELLERFGARERGELGVFDGTMEKLGLTDDKYKTDNWDFTDAKDLLLWCNGPSCGQSPRAIRGLLAAGYPADKLYYYRGGMQLWQLWGLTTVTPGQ